MISTMAICTGRAMTTITMASVRHRSRTILMLASSVSPRFSGRIRLPTYPSRAGGPPGGATLARRLLAVALHRDAARAAGSGRRLDGQRRRIGLRGRRRHPVLRDDVARVLERDQLAAAQLALDRVDLAGRLGLQLGGPALERVDAAPRALELLLEAQHVLDAGEVEAELVGHLLDAPQALDVLVRVQPRALGRALGLDQPALLVHAQRLGVHLGQLGGDGDHEDPAVAADRHGRARRAPHENSLALGSSPITSDSFSTASDCSALSVAGTSMTNL